MYEPAAGAKSKRRQARRMFAIDVQGAAFPYFSYNIHMERGRPALCNQGVVGGAVRYGIALAKQAGKGPGTCKACLGNALQVAAFQMLAEISRVERFAGRIGDQRIGREAATVTPDILLQPMEHWAQVALGNVTAQ